MLLLQCLYRVPPRVPLEKRDGYHGDGYPRKEHTEVESDCEPTSDDQILTSNVGYHVPWFRVPKSIVLVALETW